MRILVLGGPNLNRLGTREPQTYGTQTLDDIIELLRKRAGSSVEIDARQSNFEGQLVEWLHEAADARTPVILNPAALTHYSIALRDAVSIVTETGTPLIEVHLSNPHAREVFRHTSVISPVATGVVAGLGAGSYLAALEGIRAMIEATRPSPETLH
ncbi:MULTISPECIES: type II 3-dehydroquinate dehydratase [unclassified Pseudoclavibacter]|uniref:type II 3-dehydroquinate dehydratase n=1 Tax=unclassified Pseudoclavibacter TaxID=2615177 RepID=UPI0012F30AF2|nr:MULTISPECIES: type II 3-dehydroquinate dehydratase [unclassified Pseudoclavibacter]MBF4459334.1 type II 3-dehydroquinate dehydratase [Pseudoclavibacter sp. VKM Ac-2867]VXB23434.1 3-dehydroquinate dehydratase, type II [Pseudoclavibacter sp. 8L]